MTEDEIKHALKLDTINDREWKLQGCSAKNNTGLD